MWPCAPVTWALRSRSHETCAARCTGCAWVNYVRCHDDIGWTFDDADAARLGINGFDHRRFLNAYYTGRFPGSFARGLPFQENPKTGDARISGTCASLAGLEKALLEETDAQVELAVRRILLLHSVILSIGGISLIYLGDEIGILNDYSYRRDRDKEADSRWVHRPFTDWGKMARRSEPGAVEGRIYTGLRHMIDVRKRCPALGEENTTIFDTGNAHVFGYVRRHEGEQLLALANFSEAPQAISVNTLRTYGVAYHFRDLVSGEDISPGHDLTLAPHRFVWLQAGT